MVPKVSVFTPTHHPRFLDECFESLQAQRFEDWEWIVVLNNRARWTSPAEDSRVQVVEAPRDCKGVGALKHFACELASGDYLVELDHDDLLVPEALGEVVRAFDANPQIGFVSSEFSQINEDGSRCESKFNLAMGWEYREVEVEGRSLLQCDTFPAFPSNVGYIWFAPNHLRAFRRTTYEAVGGYDASLDILDDQDLMSRLYLEAEFHHIPQCLYLQRLHGLNTQVDPRLNGRIQVETVQMYDRYIERLALAWAKRRGLYALDLGAAHRKPNGYVGVDIHPGQGVDIVADVRRGIDLPEGSVGVIRAVDFLQHVPDKISLFNEIYRLLAHGGMLLSLTPSTDGRGAFQDPTHVSFYNENSFWYFTRRSYSNFVPELKCRFQSSRLLTFYPDEWHEQNLIAYVNANLVAVKDGPRLAGELLI